MEEEDPEMKFAEAQFDLFSRLQMNAIQMESEFRRRLGRPSGIVADLRLPLLRSLPRKVPKRARPPSPSGEPSVSSQSKKSLGLMGPPAPKKLNEKVIDLTLVD